MKLPNRALMAVLIVTAISLQISPAATAGSSDVSQRMKRQVERVQQHHDRKLELRAATLGMTATELKDELKAKSFRQILKEHGFKNKDDFYIALQGKVRDELHKRGFSNEQIEQQLLKRQQRAIENHT